ncbi:hypothetical protein KCP74_15395 [Salmonella enterica subsp. enterica]|nr:hypothetical protein KCP74_15395 [Salmonella enterica subsp. enterica]
MMLSTDTLLLSLNLLLTPHGTAFTCCEPERTFPPRKSPPVELFRHDFPVFSPPHFNQQAVQRRFWGDD